MNGPSVHPLGLSVVSIRVFSFRAPARRNDLDIPPGAFAGFVLRRQQSERASEEGATVRKVPTQPQQSVVLSLPLLPLPLLPLLPIPPLLPLPTLDLSTRMMVTRGLWSAVCLLLWSNAHSQSSAANTLGKSRPLTLPLIPHHVQEARRRLELGLQPSNSTAARSFLRRRLPAKPKTVAALYQGYGTHYVDLWVGTPPQRQTLVVDTGSSITAFPCNDCAGTKCGVDHHTDSVFQQDQSSSYKPTLCKNPDGCTVGFCIEEDVTDDTICTIQNMMDDESGWTAAEATDMVYLGGLHTHAIQSKEEDNSRSHYWNPLHASFNQFRMTFGCQDTVSGLPTSALADGVLALDHADTSFWQQAYSKDLIITRAFSLCFAHQRLAAKSGTEAGAFTLGATEDRLHDTPMLFTHHKPDSEFQVVLRKIHLYLPSKDDAAIKTRKEGDKAWSVTNLNGRDPRRNRSFFQTLATPEADLNHGDVLIDSGTSDTYLNKLVMKSFRIAFHQLCGREFKNEPMTLTDEELNNLPTIVLQLVGDSKVNPKNYPDPNHTPGLAGEQLDPTHPYDVLVAIPPQHYMEYEPLSEQYVPRVYLNQDEGGILGANVLMGHQVFFDIEKRRIGFAESTCNYSDIVDKEGYEFGTDLEQGMPDEEQLQEEEAHQEVEAEEGDEIDKEMPTENNTETEADLDQDYNANDDTGNDDDVLTTTIPKHNDETGAISATKTVSSGSSVNNNVHPAIAACNDWQCRTGLAGAFCAVLLVGILAGRYSQQQTVTEGAYHAPEEFVPSMNDDDDEDGDGDGNNDGDENGSTDGAIFQDDGFEHRFAQYKDDPDKIAEDDNVYRNGTDVSNGTSNKRAKGDEVDVDGMANSALEPIRIV